MGIVIDSNGVIDIAASTPGKYRITYTTAGTCPSSSFQDVTINALDNAAFSYSASSYSTTGADPTPTITGLTGGTFSGSTGLVINSTTGEIDLSASTAASHTVTYNTSSSGSSVCPNTSTFNLAIVINQIANNYSMNFDSASSDYIASPLNNVFNSATQSTISFWAKKSSSSNEIVLGAGTAETNSIYILWYSNSYVYFGTRATGATAFNINYVFSGSDKLDVWHHFVGVYNAGTSSLYINGSLVSGPTSGGPSSLGSNIDSTFTIGRLGDVTTYNSTGQIDEVAIWNTALTSTQIADIYNAKGTNLTKYLTTVSGSNLKYWNRMGD